MRGMAMALPMKRMGKAVAKPGMKRVSIAISTLLLTTAFAQWINHWCGQVFATGEDAYATGNMWQQPKSKQLCICNCLKLI